MKYVGKLFGQIGRTRGYFDTGKTSEDWDALEARAERAEASLHALRLVCGTTDADKFSTWVDRANARAEKAEAELAGIRALADRRNKRDHSADTTHQLVVALDQALDIAQAELAATKSTLDEEVNCAEKAEHEVVRQYARAERAEAEVERLKNLLLQADALNEGALFKISETIARAERAEARVKQLEGSK